MHVIPRCLTCGIEIPAGLVKCEKCVACPKCGLRFTIGFDNYRDIEINRCLNCLHRWESKIFKFDENTGVENGT